MRILCFGDSNTYGCDPRSLLGERYPPNARWPELLRSSGWEAVNCGQNGREVPTGPENWPRSSSCSLKTDLWTCFS